MLSETIRSGDWKGEKHVPVIEYEREGDLVKVEVSVGKEIAHPNKPEHNISWIQLWFHPEGGMPVLVGQATFDGHDDPLTEPRVVFFFRTNKKGKLYALSYCNLHGLWESEVQLE